MYTGEYALAEKVLLEANKKEVKFLNGKTSSSYSDALCNLGLLKYHTEDDLAAIDYYRDGLEDNFTFDLAWNYGNARLRQYCSRKFSDLKFCWQMYETRFQIGNAVVLGDRVNWTGGFVDSITVLAEQGIGDCIMFARYLPYLKQYCNKVVVQCEPELNFLYENPSNNNKIETTHAVASGSLGNLLDYIPAGDWIGGWTGGTDIIGCVWKSNNNHSNNTLRNTTADRMLGLGNIMSIGPDCNDERIPKLPSSTWKETYESLKTVKCVVTIDSAIAHLCGAMNVPCYVLMPLRNTDFRWGDSSMGYDNLWYKSVKVIRNPNSWDTTFERVRECLKLADQT
jgi:hypothetical protein